MASFWDWKFRDMKTPDFSPKFPIKEVLERDIQPIVVGSKKSYKQWTVAELLIFRYPFSIGNTKYRILLVKVKNSVYIEFHLGDHKYYDKVRKELMS